VEQIVVWRKPAKRGPTTPLVVLLHGRGADELDLIDIGDVLPSWYAYASVRAPVQVENGGYTWYESRRGPGDPTAESLRASITGLREWLDGPECAAFNRERTYVLGFSAGMMMAAALLLDDPARFAGAVLLSGAIAFDAGIDTPPPRLARRRDCRRTRDAHDALSTRAKRRGSQRSHLPTRAHHLEPRAHRHSGVARGPALS
jgi:predicted esterase